MKSPLKLAIAVLSCMSPALVAVRPKVSFIAPRAARPLFTPVVRRPLFVKKAMWPLFLQPAVRPAFIGAYARPLRPVFPFRPRVARPLVVRPVVRNAFYVRPRIMLGASFGFRI